MGKFYRIKEETMTAIADITRKMAGRSAKLSPDEIAYWLNRVAYIPQGNAESAQSISQVSSASGIVPTVYRGTAISVQSIYNTSNAVGSLESA